jgi:hypothetical protein
MQAHLPKELAVDKLRTLPFIVALVLAVLVLGVELGSSFLSSPASQSVDTILATIDEDPDLQEAYGELDEEERQKMFDPDAPPGVAIRTMALVDGLLLFTVGLIGLSLLLRERITGRVQGILTLIVSLLVLLGAIALLLLALIPSLILMVSLFLAVPFGTLAYLAGYGFFNRGGASMLLGILMALKLGFAACIVVAQQRFLQNRGLVLLILTSVLCVVIVGFLHGIVPIILVSITDAIAAIVLAILAAIWALVLLIGSVGSVLKALRVDRA